MKKREGLVCWLDKTLRRNRVQRRGKLLFSVNTLKFMHYTQLPRKQMIARVDEFFLPIRYSAVAKSSTKHSFLLIRGDQIFGFSSLAHSHFLSLFYSRNWYESSSRSGSLVATPRSSLCRENRDKNESRDRVRVRRIRRKL